MIYVYSYKETITLLALICPALICLALRGQIDFGNLSFRGEQKKAGQIKGWPKLGQLKYFAQSNWTCSIVCIELIMIFGNFKLFDIK